MNSCSPTAQSEFAQRLLTQRRITAARRALGIVNRFRPSEYKAKHSSRILSHLNKLRAQL